LSVCFESGLQEPTHSLQVSDSRVLRFISISLAVALALKHYAAEIQAKIDLLYCYSRLQTVLWSGPHGALM